MNDGRWDTSLMTALFGLLRWASSKPKSEGCLPEVFLNNHCIDRLCLHYVLESGCLDELCLQFRRGYLRILK